MPQVNDELGGHGALYTSSYISTSSPTASEAYPESTPTICRDNWRLLQVCYGSAFQVWTDSTFWTESLKKIRYDSFKGRVLLYTIFSYYFIENVHMFDACDFIGWALPEVWCSFLELNCPLLHHEEILLSAHPAALRGIPASIYRLKQQFLLLRKIQILMKEKEMKSIQHQRGIIKEVDKPARNRYKRVYPVNTFLKARKGSGRHTVSL